MRVSLTSRSYALPLLVLHLSSRFFLLPAPVSSGQRPSPPTGSKKFIKKLKSQQTPLSSVPSVITNTSLPFHPSGKADLSDGSVCEGSPPRSPHWMLCLSFCPCASRKALSGFPSRAHVLCRSQQAKDLNEWCRYSDLPKISSVSQLLWAVTFPGHKSRWNVSWIPQKALRLQPW